MGKFLYRMHEWAAERFSFVQYPRIRRTKVERVSGSWAGPLLKWLVFVILMWWLWAPVVLIVGFFVLASFGSQPS
ncbi:hypothetical protein [Pandoraea sp. SD6-2]|uniref:hypothetical protein n=1 Tax=Pandoraea sp. SD6-2 TaxID=1286093 RepID=UPI00032D80F2|nr:hypothetical protein [Pandoraea sp. SD6-2]EON13156.1 hypothetical protein C266_14129 [Pandoraea sp. SD6-2]